MSQAPSKRSETQVLTHLGWMKFKRSLISKAMQFIDWIAERLGIDNRDKDVPATAPPRLTELSPYELAFVTGGWQRVLQATVAELVRCGALEIAQPKRWRPYRIRALAKRSAGILPIERLVHQRAAGSTTGMEVYDLFFGGYDGVNDLQESLQERGLLEHAQTLQLRRAVCLMCLYVAAIAVCAVAISLASCAGFVLLLVTISFCVGGTCQIMALPPKRTPAADALLEDARRGHQRLRRFAKALGDSSMSVPTTLLRGEMALAIALFGVEACTQKDEPLRQITDERLRELWEHHNSSDG